MSIKKIIISAFLLLPALLHAQYNRDVSYNTIGLSSPQVVRSWNNSLVTAYSYGKGTVFTYSDFSPFFGPLSSSCITAPLQHSAILMDYFVNDMIILDGMVFFCGLKVTTGNVWNGMVGWFYLSDFSSPNITPEVYDFFPNVFELTKMVVYSNGGRYKVVAIGYDDIQFPNYDNSVILEIEDIRTPPLSHQLYTINRNIAPYEHIDDIIFTGDKVILAGEINYTSANHMPCIRVMDNLNSFASSTGYNTLYSFNSNTEINGRVKAIATDRDEMCIAYSHPDFSTGTYTTQIRIIKNLSGVPFNGSSQSFANDYKDVITDMTYLPNLKELVLLHPFVLTPLDDPKFIYILPYSSSSYNADYTLFANSEYYKSLDVFNTDNIAAVGENRIYMQYVPSFTGMRCPDLKNLKVSIIDNSPVIRQPVFTFPTPVSFTRSSHPLNISNTQWIGDCCY